MGGVLGGVKAGHAVRSRGLGCGYLNMGGGGFLGPQRGVFVLLVQWVVPFNMGRRGGVGVLGSTGAPLQTMMIVRDHSPKLQHEPSVPIRSPSTSATV